MLKKLLEADQLGLRLEWVGGLPLWEAQPTYRHQKAVDRIRQSIRPKEGSSCPCIHVADVYVRFPDGSYKRPDIALFCREPEELDEAITLLPEAVVEVVSRGYEAKDLEIAPRFYLSQGVKDVVIFDPHTLLVLHLRQKGAWRHVSPVELELLCGCTLTV
ncbi:Uma2 family endonuclease [Thermus amyloliquefaciens]|uniref:Uma2 family endonuclease n=1 Tax=Thermus amyloliquefaciens TaxID=1449080 RepID=UPI000570D38A|nr:Uma2 family endonuclease [Thermus amyloliquefaciens]